MDLEVSLGACLGSSPTQLRAAATGRSVATIAIATYDRKQPKSDQSLTELSPKSTEE